MVPKRVTVVLPYLGGLFLWFFFIIFQATAISGGDSGDLVTAAYTGGVPHPPGYPLYTFLGFLLSHISIGTIAWRVGLLSSLPHAATVTLVFLFVSRLTGRVASGLFASLVLVANYLFFLYSVTPEVFALFDLFLILLTFLIYRYIETKNSRYLLWASFVFGLSLSHHHVILFFVPTVAYWVWKEVKRRKKIFVLSSLFLVLGLLPYFYIPLAARGNAIINWDRAVDVPNFVRLITRADYGTFVSSGFYGTQTLERLIQLKMYLKFFALDFRWPGMILAIFGVVWLWRRNRKLTIGILLALFFLGPAFFFYASFPLVNRFTVGTYERFLLPSYLFLAILTGFGLEQSLSWLRRLTRSRLWRSRLVQTALLCILFLYPTAMVVMTMWRFWGLRNDKTAENLAFDVLAGIPEGAILLLQRDTPLFSTQYMRYSLGVRPDVKLIHSSRLPSSDYPTVVGRVFPDIVIPHIRGEGFVPEFLKANSAIFPIVSITRLPAPSGWAWVQQGLVFLLMKESDVPPIDVLVAENDALFDGFHDPAIGILSRYNHLMLADVRDVYATARIELGKTFVRAGKLSWAKQQFEAAIKTGGDTQLGDSYSYLGLTELFLDNCQGALEAFSKARSVSLTPQPELTLYQAQTYRDCFHDEERASKLFAEYQALQQARETPLGQQEQ